jgi:hypothetical protein
LQAVPIGHDGALAAYTVTVVIGNGGSPVTVKFAVGEVWVKQTGEWKCPHDQATILK